MIAYGAGIRDWLEKQLGCTTAYNAEYMGWLKNNELVAACAFSNYTGDDIELSVAALPGSGTRKMIATIFGYVFGPCACARCTVRIRDDNHASMKLARRLGFRYEGRQRKAKDGHDLLMYGLLREDFTYGQFPKGSKAGGPEHDHPGTGACEPG